MYRGIQNLEPFYCDSKPYILYTNYLLYALATLKPLNVLQFDLYL